VVGRFSPVSISWRRGANISIDVGKAARQAGFAAIKAVQAAQTVSSTLRAVGWRRSFNVSLPAPPSIEPGKTRRIREDKGIVAAAALQGFEPEKPRVRKRTVLVGSSPGSNWRPRSGHAGCRWKAAGQDHVQLVKGWPLIVPLKHPRPCPSAQPPAASYRPRAAVCCLRAVRACRLKLAPSGKMNVSSPPFPVMKSLPPKALMILHCYRGQAVVIAEPRMLLILTVVR